MTNLYVDLRIIGGDFVLGPGSEPDRCNNRVSIGQDVVHMIIESALTKRLVAERSPVLRYDILQQLELLVETDARIVPGTVSITDPGTGHHTITADTWDFGPLSEEVNP